MAFAVLETLQCELGVSIPDDVSVIGLDDVEMASWKIYNLTTLRQPVNRMVESTIAMMLDMIDDRATEKRIEIGCELVIRGSVQVPEHWPPILR